MGIGGFLPPRNRLLPGGRGIRRRRGSSSTTSSVFVAILFSKSTSLHQVVLFEKAVTLSAVPNATPLPSPVIAYRGLRCATNLELWRAQAVRHPAGWRKPMAFYDPTTDPDYPAPTRQPDTGFDCTGIALLPAATVVALIMMLSSGGDGRAGVTHTGSPTPPPPSAVDVPDGSNSGALPQNRRPSQLRSPQPSHCRPDNRADFELAKGAAADAGADPVVVRRLGNDGLLVRACRTARHDMTSAGCVKTIRTARGRITATRTCGAGTALPVGHRRDWPFCFVCAQRLRQTNLDCEAPPRRGAGDVPDRAHQRPPRVECGWRASSRAARDCSGCCLVDGALRSRSLRWSYPTIRAWRVRLHRWLHQARKRVSRRPHRGRPANPSHHATSDACPTSVVRRT